MRNLIANSITRTPTAVTLSPQTFASAVFALLLLGSLTATWVLTNGHFFYTLDDPYIHLALAERIAHGHYGINIGEVTSPSSSVIWPFLLVPGAGTVVHDYVPLALNAACGVATAVLFGRFAQTMPLGEFDGDHPVRHVIAGLLVVAANLPGLALTGMEHSLQVLLATIVAMGLIEAWKGNAVPQWAIAAAMIGPALRYEMAGLVLAVAFVLIAQKKIVPALVLCGASTLLPIGLSMFFVSNGLHPLPNSVVAKLANSDIDLTYLPQRALLMAIVVGLLAAVVKAPAQRRMVLLAVVLVGALHFIGGKFGWFYRYEVYAVVFCGLVALWVASESWPVCKPWMVAGIGVFAALAGCFVIADGRFGWDYGWRSAIVVGCCAFMTPMAIQAWPVRRHWVAWTLGVCSLVYAAPLVLSPAAAHNVYDQQYQMGRFVRDYYGKAFAVNDLGLVSFKLDPSIYVLDLYGLASNEAVRQRVKSAPWLDDVTRRHGAGLAMIYETWFADLPKSWTRVATLTLSSERITPASEQVAFYATAVGNADEIRRRLLDFKSSLPVGVKLDIQ